MPSLFTHAVSAVALGRATTRERPSRRFWWLAVFCACFPDADVLGFAHGISYEDLWGHRGMTHSLPFAAFLGIAAAWFYFRQAEERPTRRAWWQMATVFALITASHGVFDAMTNGGLGIAFLSPLRTTRYFLPWQPIQVSPIGVGSFFSEWGLRVMASEVLWVWLPCLLLVGVVEAVRRPDPGPKVPKGPPGRSPADRL